MAILANKMAKGNIQQTILSLYSENINGLHTPSDLQENIEKPCHLSVFHRIKNVLVYTIAAFFLLLILNSCKEHIFLPDFDNKAWQQDKGGCLGKRKILLQKILDNKNKLKGYSTEDIIEFLGRPDKKNLYNRNQKFFYYYSEPGEHCIDPKSDSQSRFISIRFSALDRATEIVYY